MQGGGGHLMSTIGQGVGYACDPLVAFGNVMWRVPQKYAQCLLADSNSNSELTCSHAAADMRYSDP